MKKVLSSILVLVVPLLALSAPPTLKIPELKATGDYVTHKPETDAVSVEYVGLSGVDAFPTSFLENKKAFILPTRGLKDGRYEFVAVAASSSGEQSKTKFVVIIGEDKPAPPIGGNPPPKDTTPPKENVFYFAIIRPDGPASAEFTKVISDPAWNELRNKGHTIKDFTLSEMGRLGYTIPSGITLPSVLTLVEKDGKSSIKRQPVPLPSDKAGILKLPEGL